MTSLLLYALFPRVKRKELTSFTIKGEWYGQLRSFEYFKRVTTDGFTVIWPDGQDICPDELYDFGKLVS